MFKTRSSRKPILNRGLIAETGTIPAGYQLLQDSYRLNVIETKKVMVEDINGKEVPVMRVTGQFQESDIENANGRIYPHDVLAEAVKMIQEDCGHRSVFGEFDHPVDAKLHLERVSHLITKVWMDNHKIYGEAEILDNQPFGKSLRGLFERKCRVGISSRGVGDMEMKEGSNNKQLYYVQPGYTIVTWDVVAEPSVSGCTLAVMEGLNKTIKPLHEARRKNLLVQATYEKLLLEEIDKYFNLKPIK